MWIHREQFQHLYDDWARLQRGREELAAELGKLAGAAAALREQKIRDDLSLDWMRHRVNALEKQHAVLMQKVAGVAMPVPEIVPTLPGTSLGFDTMPSFEDVGDDEATRLGVEHDEEGNVVYSK